MVRLPVTDSWPASATCCSLRSFSATSALLLPYSVRRLRLPSGPYPRDSLATHCPSARWKMLPSPRPRRLRAMLVPFRLLEPFLDRGNIRLVLLCYLLDRSAFT